mmetsp:Transcript_23810/g.35156  ORF Transcript_23810/g.35156 Transcript_23810/m.35156 type:complete len:153 (+) Transcript_23810:453-911(+)
MDKLLSLNDLSSCVNQRKLIDHTKQRRGSTTTRYHPIPPAPSSQSPKIPKMTPTPSSKTISTCGIPSFHHLNESGITQKEEELNDDEKEDLIYFYLKVDRKRRADKNALESSRNGTLCCCSHSSSDFTNECVSPNQSLSEIIHGQCCICEQR